MPTKFNPTNKTVNELKDYLRKRNIKWPAWCKKPALITLVKRSQQNPAALETASRHRTTRSGSRTHPTLQQSGDFFGIPVDDDSRPSDEEEPEDVSQARASLSQPSDHTAASVGSLQRGVATGSSHSSRVDLVSTPTCTSQGHTGGRQLSPEMMLLEMRSMLTDMKQIQAAGTSAPSLSSSDGVEIQVAPLSQEAVQQKQQHDRPSSETAYNMYTAMNAASINSANSPVLNNCQGRPYTEPVYNANQAHQIPYSAASVSTTTLTDNPAGLASSNLNAFPSATYSCGVPSDSLPHIDIISPALRKDIITGKDVNLASLLIPGYNQESNQPRHLIQGSEVIALKPLSDSRLNKSLTISEFLLAFGIYKNVMSDVFPQRRRELGGYERDIIEMSHRFGGSSFYEYHRAFSARAATLLTIHNIKVDWSTRDTKLFCSIFAGHKANSCTICNSLAHSTEFCPQQLLSSDARTGMNDRSAYSSSARTRASDDIDSKGRHLIFIDGKEVCNDFNGHPGCTRDQCRYLHVCFTCKKGTHASHLCSMNKDKPRSGPEA